MFLRILLHLNEMRDYIDLYPDNKLRLKELKELLKETKRGFASRVLQTGRI